MAAFGRTLGDCFVFDTHDLRPELRIISARYQLPYLSYTSTFSGLMQASITRVHDIAKALSKQQMDRNAGRASGLPNPAVSSSSSSSS
jgi:hypothetical protein